MIRTLFIFFLALIVVQSGSVLGKAQTKRPTNNGQRVERADSRPDLAAAFDDVAQLKIVARKPNYHIGEMITLDIALINRSSRQLFVRKLSEVQVNVRNSTGKSITVQTYVVADRALVPSSFVRLPANEMSLHSFQLLVGCDKRAFSQTAEDDELTIFKNGLFLNWGDACLHSTTPETYTFSVEFKNNAVLVSSRMKDIRTAVGTIKSNSLEIKVSNCSVSSADPQSDF